MLERLSSVPMPYVMAIGFFYREPIHDHGIPSNKKKRDRLSSKQGDRAKRKGIKEPRYYHLSIR
jgi:hypothetical protein